MLGGEIVHAWVMRHAGGARPAAAAVLRFLGGTRCGRAAPVQRAALRAPRLLPAAPGAGPALPCVLLLERHDVCKRGALHAPLRAL